MGTLNIYDKADEFRIEIAGRFAGECVQEVDSNWRNALLEAAPRNLVVDISRLSGYDAAGRKLLHDMYRHGTQFAAGTPLSLVFLNEISSPARKGPTLVHAARVNHAPPHRNAPTHGKRKSESEAHVSAIASGQ